MKKTARMLVPALLAGLMLVGCSDDDNGEEAEDLEEFDITLDITSYPMTMEAELAATGPAVDEGLLCATATQTGHGFENSDGSELSLGELERLNDGSDPFAYVAIGQWDCDDDSGSFTFRTLNDVEDATAFELTATWELVGGDGYQAVSGEGQNHGITVSDQDGTIVMFGNNTGVLRAG